jgi:hypothetical protein
MTSKMLGRQVIGHMQVKVVVGADHVDIQPSWGSVRSTSYVQLRMARSAPRAQVVEHASSETQDVKLQQRPRPRADKTMRNRALQLMGDPVQRDTQVTSLLCTSHHATTTIQK